jgi:hypothetical protein
VSDVKKELISLSCEMSEGLESVVDVGAETQEMPAVRHSLLERRKQREIPFTREDLGILADIYVQTEPIPSEYVAQEPEKILFLINKAWGEPAFGYRHLASIAEIELAKYANNDHVLVKTGFVADNGCPQFHIYKRQQ